MKLYKLFMGVTAAAMFAACSSDEVAVQAPEWNADGTGYVAFSISNAEEGTVSRGVNDEYAHGDKAEYDVKDVLLVVCDKDGNVKEAHIMAPGFGGPNAPGTNVTADKLYVQKISAMDGDPYGFVIINRNGLFSTSEGNLMCGTTPVTNINTLAETIQANLSLNASAFTNNGILMMNAPLADKAGTTSDPTGAKLSYFVNPLKVYETEEAANVHANGVGEVYVERAVAKVELGGTDSSTEGLNWAIQGWTLDNTNKSSYLLHNVSNMNADVIKYNAESKGFRMIGYKDVQHDLPASLGTGTEVSSFRTYFGEDPNMGLSAADAVTAFNRVADYAELTFENPKYQYCAENLFDVEHQNYGNTTRALIKVQLTAPEGTVYFSKPGDNKFYTEEAVKNAAQTAAAKKIAESNLWNNIVATTEDGRIVFTTTIQTDGTVKVVATGAKLEITAEEATGLGYADVAAATAEYTALMTQTLNAKDFGFNYYAGGVAYYDVRIKHFGNDYCPWNKTAENINTTAAAYDADYNANAYLGRWGVLRNNWYAINIKDIKNVGYADPYDLDLKPRTPGDPNDPDGPDPDTPDDNTPDSEKWIAVDVNVLSWAKRTQEEEL